MAVIPDELHPHDIEPRGPLTSTFRAERAAGVMSLEEPFVKDQMVIGYLYAPGQSSEWIECRTAQIAAALCLAFFDTSTITTTLVDGPEIKRRIIIRFVDASKTWEIFSHLVWQGFIVWYSPWSVINCLRLRPLSYKVLRPTRMPLESECLFTPY
ncbi:hypothetical protein PLIIFM63780_006771 [Purpureocillium lilacinum]|nr:hypothetical protein PLIIFM63780_006771 [Purpureocillium lilacinum]